MNGMTELQAIGLTVAFVMALSITIALAVFITALRYELQDRRAKRAAHRHAEPLTTRPRVGMSSRYSA